VVVNVIVWEVYIDRLETEGGICWGFPTGGVLIFAQRREKHTDTIFNVVRQNRLHPRERVIVLEIEKGLQ
jgi:hypothetical protein